MSDQLRPNAANYWYMLRQQPTDAPLWLNLARHYAKLHLPWQSAYAARQALRCDAGLQPKLDALNINQWQNPAASDGKLGQAMLSDSVLWVTPFSEALADCPGDWLTLLYLTRLKEMPSEAPLATETELKALQALEIIPGESLHWLGVWRLNAGDGQEAVTALAALVNVMPMRYGSMMYLGEALLRIGNEAAAEAAFTRASQSNNTDFLLALAQRVYNFNYWQEAIAVLQKAGDLNPTAVAPLLALARIQSEVYDLEGCRQSLNRLQQLEPTHPEPALMIAGLQGRTGDAKAYFAGLQKAYADSGDPLSRLASSIAMTSLYQDDLTAIDVAGLHQQLCAPITDAMHGKARSQNSFRLDSSKRRLRIGYVTGDLHRQHPVNIFMLPVLLRHNHQQFEIHIFHTGTLHDAYTRQAKASADYWLEAWLLDDFALQQAIGNAGIDILIDLAGHTSSHRLGVFALRAAPVQATFLGYPNTTGLAGIDWLIGDSIVTPAEHTGLYSEGLAQLPGCVFCFASVDTYPLPPARAADSPVVFGSFNNAMKLSAKTIALWSRVLKAVPEAKLLLKAPSLKDNAVKARFTALFRDQGIEQARLELRGPTGLSEMMQEYGDIDIALDPLPYNGGTTTQQALWMGVPVISLMGHNFVSRMGGSFLTALGRSEWLAFDEQAYVANAIELAGQCPTLRKQRPQLRAQMAASPLCDIDNYVCRLEALYSQMWQARCKGSVERVLSIAERPL